MLYPISRTARKSGAEYLQLLHLRVPRTSRMEFGRGKAAFIAHFVVESISLSKVLRMELCTII